VLRGDQVPQLKWSAPDEEALVAFLVGEWRSAGSGQWLCVALLRSCYAHSAGMQSVSLSTSVVDPLAVLVLVGDRS
jgi:hypothetical protein